MSDKNKVHILAYSHYLERLFFALVETAQGRVANPNSNPKRKYHYLEKLMSTQTSDKVGAIE